MSEVSNTPTLLGESCPKCGSEEAWHGVITEPGEDDRFACDECGMWLAVSVSKPAAKKPVLSQLGTRLIQTVIDRLDAIEDDAASERAYADFGMNMLTMLVRGPSAEVTISHLDAAAAALGVKPSELVLEATS